MSSIVMNTPVAIHSTSISEVEYTQSEEILRVVFANNGAEYEYQEVPEEVYQDFLAAPSKGRFFIDNIRDQYVF